MKRRRETSSKLWSFPDAKWQILSMLAKRDISDFVLQTLHEYVVDANLVQLIWEFFNQVPFECHHSPIERLDVLASYNIDLSCIPKRITPIQGIVTDFVVEHEPDIPTILCRVSFTHELSFLHCMAKTFTPHETTELYPLAHYKLFLYKDTSQSHHVAIDWLSSKLHFRILMSDFFILVSMQVVKETLYVVTNEFVQVWGLDDEGVPQLHSHILFHSKCRQCLKKFGDDVVTHRAWIKNAMFYEHEILIVFGDCAYQDLGFYCMSIKR